MSKKTRHKTTMKESLESTTQEDSWSIFIQYTHEIVQNFVDDLEHREINIEDLSLEELQEFFVEYIRTVYNNDILKSLYEWRLTGDSIDITLSSLQHQWFLIADVTDLSKRQLILDGIGTSVTEQDSITTALQKLWDQLQELPQKTQDQLAFDEFLVLIWYQFISPTKIEAKAHHAQYSFYRIKTLRREHIYSTWITESTRVDNYDAMFDTEQYDPLEKLVAASVIDNLYQTIEFLSDKKAIKDVAESHFWVLEYPLQLDFKRNKLTELFHRIEQFFQKISWFATSEDIEVLKNTKITLEHSINTMIKSWLLSQEERNKILTASYSQLNKNLKQATSIFAQIDIITSVSSIIDDLDDTIQEYTQGFDIPWNMSDFFKQFWTPGFYRWWSRDFVYLSLAQKERKLVELLASWKLSSSEYQAKENELQELRNKINNHQKTEHFDTRNNYFDHIANQVEYAQKELWQTNILWSSLYSTLHKLRDTSRNIAELSLAEQNILMKTSIAMQLLAVKTKWTLKNRSYSFQEYAQFVSALYDLESQHAQITTKDGEKIDLNFTKKKIVGKPSEFHSIDINNISDLSRIRIEFELDLSSNERAEYFIRTMTGWPRSRIIRNFFEKDGFPTTITDSSYVSMVSKDGQEYSGYLSPINISVLEDEYDFWDDEYDYGRQATSFVLYSEPADQFHKQRTIITQKDRSWQEILSQSWKKCPVFINSWNINTWQSVEIKNKKVTLSDQYLKSLTLGQLALNKINDEDFFDPKNSPDIQETLNQEDSNISEIIREDTRDIEDELLESWEVEMRRGFEQLWNEITKESDKPCEIWVRLVLKYPDVVDGNPIIKTFPQTEQLITARVTSLKKDEEGNIVSCTLEFESLTRLWETTIKETSFDVSNLQKLTQVFESVQYLDAPSDNHTYEWVLQRLQNKYPNYHRDKLNGLQFDGKKFINNKNETINHFVAPWRTRDKDGKEYLVDYSLKSLWRNRYRVTSSPYMVDIMDEKWKSQKRTIAFDTITDLSGVLLILAGKWLHPESETEFTLRQANDPHGALLPQTRSAITWWSLQTVMGVIKTGGKQLRDWWLKKLEESRQWELGHIVFQEMNIYRKLDNIFGAVLDKFDMNFLNDLAWEAEEKAMNYWFDKIEVVYKNLKSFHKSYNIWGLDWLWTKTPWSWARTFEMIEEATTYLKAGKRVPYKNLVQVAGALRYNMETYKNGYAPLRNQFEQWTYVKILLWEHAYEVYKEQYEKLRDEMEMATNPFVKKQKQDQLMSLEYEFISHNIAGGGRMDDRVFAHPRPRYYQELYSRSYGNKLRAIIPSMKMVSTDKKSETIQQLIDIWNFDQCQSDFYNYIASWRLEEAVQNLIAMQNTASTRDQYNEIMIAMMTGILNGQFIHTIWLRTRMDLKNAFRNSAIPFAHWIEEDTWPQKLMALLRLATADLWSNSFDSMFSVEEITSYSTFNINQRKNAWQEFVEKFAQGARGQTGWLQEWSFARERLVSFLHLDKQSMSSNNNMFHIWKSSKDNLPTIFWQKITLEQKEVVDDIMDDLYFGVGKSANLDNYGFDFPYPATNIEEFSRDLINRSISGAKFDENLLGRGVLYYTSIIENHAPSNNKLSANQKELLAYHTNEFFRIFWWIWALSNTKETIQQFYTYVRKAQQQENTWDRRRLLAFPLVEKIYERWPIPQVVETALRQYLLFFATNLDNYDERVASYHLTPQDKSSNFAPLFKKPLRGYLYDSSSTRARRTRGDKNQIRRMAENNNELLINREIELRNRSFKYPNKLWMTCDEKIQALFGWIIHSWVASTRNYSPRISTQNHAEIDMEVLGESNDMYDSYDTDRINNYSKKVSQWWDDDRESRMEDFWAERGGYH